MLMTADQITLINAKELFHCLILISYLSTKFKFVSKLDPLFQEHNTVLHMLLLS